MDAIETAGKVQLVLGFLSFLIVYLFPWIVARCYKRRQSDAILAVNLFFGWTFIGWGVALVWAMVEDKR